MRTVERIFLYAVIVISIAAPILKAMIWGYGTVLDFIGALIIGAAAAFGCRIILRILSRLDELENK